VRRQRRLGRSVLLCTDTRLPVDEIVHAYLEKDEVEKVWRIGKGALGLNGIKHWKRDRVVSYLLVCYLAYLLWTAVRQRLREKKFDITPDRALSILKRIEVVRFRSSGREYHEFPRSVGVEEKLQNAFGLKQLKDAVMVK
jgi:transposase